MNIQPILNIAETCYQTGIEHVFISPGSRSAPITLGFANHPKINCKIINDERSAGFIALGSALKLKNPVALVCTSGTAVLNYAPAIAEAYYQQIPLLVITADRPPELIDQQDGQCLKQFEIFKNYIKSSYQTPDNLQNEESVNVFYKVLGKSVFDVNNQTPAGPVHLNIPIREPFYPTEKISYTDFNFEVNKIKSDDEFDYSNVINHVNSSNKVLFIAGQQNYSIELNKQVDFLVNQLNYPLIADINSNLTSIRNLIKHEDFIFSELKEELQPDIVITFGNSILSKKLKLYFRKKKIIHYHIAETSPFPDFFFQLKKGYKSNPIDFFNTSIDKLHKGNKEYQDKWLQSNNHIESEIKDILDKADWSEPFIIHETLKNLPIHSHIHLSNSMTVRWVNMINYFTDKNYIFQSNRGVSGIDGCTSTALGYAIESENDNFLITGDIAFFYDRNAFWNNYIPNNFKIILLNNHEGGIFNMIPGPNNNPDSLKYFTSSQYLKADLLAKEFNLGYFYAENKDSFKESFKQFLSSNKCSILELKTDSKINKEILDQLKGIKF